MNTETFVDAIRDRVLNSAAEDCIETYEDGPPGRAPRREDVELSEWYRGLDHKGKQMVQRVAMDVSHAAVFGLFCVLDGVRFLEDGDFELWFVGDEVKRTLLNPPGGQLLHDELNAS